MKYDKKTQRVAQKANIDSLLNDEDDIIRNMTNLILHKNDLGVKPWEKGNNMFQ